VPDVGEQFRGALGSLVQHDAGAWDTPPYNRIPHLLFGMALAGGLLVGGGLLSIGLAALEMRRARTTVIPHMEPDALVTSGIFRRSRNPIYVGDALVLTGLILRWGAWPSLVLVPLFVWLITDRFVLDEEARLRARFGAAFDAYVERTRRWL